MGPNNKGNQNGQQAVQYSGNQISKISRTVLLLLSTVLGLANAMLSFIAWKPDHWFATFVLPHFGVFFSLSVAAVVFLLLWVLQFKIVE